MKIRDGYYDSLPVGEIAGKLNTMLSETSRVVVTAPPGSGKSTLLPLTILQGMDERGDKSGRVIMLEPRRAAARQIAMRMAQMLGEKPGETVGYRMRFETKVSAATRIEVVTEGVMERILVDDATLEGVSVVIFDEFHERSLTADLTLAMTLAAQNEIRSDLRVVLMSATIETDELCRALSAGHIEANGRLYDVEIIHSDTADIHNCVAAVVSAVKRAYREREGNILAFLPGQAEIMRCNDALGEGFPDAVVMPLYGLMSPQEQYRALEYNPEGKRKIVLATPIAETSLTISGIRTVIDSGLYRVSRYRPATGLSYLETERISMDMATQRAGRAGRLSDGVCYRLWPKVAEHGMPEQRRPEIEDADLSGLVLDIAAWDGGEPENLPWLTPPSNRNLNEARRLLTMLGALDDSGRITELGRRMSSLPCHPRIAGMLLSAGDERLRALAADIAALLEEKDPVNDENDADINTRISLLRRRRKRGADGEWRRVIRIAEQYRKMVKCREDNSDPNPTDSGMLISFAYPERIAMQINDETFRLPNGDNVRMTRTDNLSGENFLAIASMGRRIFLASPISREALEMMATSRENVSWSSKEKRIIARTEQRIGVLVISSRQIDNPDREIILKAIGKAAQKDGLSMFDFNDDVSRLQLRVSIVAAWHPELEVPDVSTERLLSTAPDWLPLYCGGATSAQELKKIDLCGVIRGLLGYEMMSEIDCIAPENLTLPCGRKARIDYRSGSDYPVVSARLQDCFGMLETPRVDGGRRPVLMELLSPGFKPVQLTRDMCGFWRDTYFEVRKELRRRYPKHRWPDNPLEVAPGAFTVKSRK